MLDPSYKNEFTEYWKTIRSCYRNPASRYELTIKWLYRRYWKLDYPLSLKGVNHKTFEIYFDILFYLIREVYMGFEPQWMFTYRYFNPDDKTRPLLMNANKFYKKHCSGKTKLLHCKTIERYDYSCCEDSKYDKWMKHRYSDLDEIYVDTHHVDKRLQRQIYGYRGIDNSRDPRPHILYFHEKGKRKHDKDKQYHTHVLLPAPTNPAYVTKTDLEDYFNKRTSKFRSLSCLSHQEIQVDEVTSVQGILSYLNKENSVNHLSLDPINSHPIQKRHGHNNTRNNCHKTKNGNHIN